MTNLLERPSRSLLTILALAIAWMVFAVQPASAQSAVEDDGALEAYGISCDQGLCTVEVSLDRVDPLAVLGASFAIEVLPENLAFLPEDAGIKIDDNLTLKLPVGDMELVDADLALTLDSDGRVDRMRGTAMVPFPSFGGLENMDADAPLKADLGLESGENLAHLQAPLDPERRYLFLDFHSGLNASAQHRIGADDVSVGLTVPRGQDATLIIDPQEPYAYLAGNVTFSVDDQLAIVGQMIDMEGAEAFLPDGLPIRQRIGLQVASSVGKGAEPFFRAGGAYSVDAGMIGRLAGFEILPLATQGVVTLERAGMMLEGVAESRIAPNVLFNGSTTAQMFLPFDTDLRAAYVQFDAEAAVPFVATSVEAMARLDGEDGILAQASVTTPLSGDAQTVALVDEGDDARRLSLVRSLAGSAGNTATRSYLFVKNNAGDGVARLAGGADAGRYWSQRVWCGVAGGCDRVTDAVAVGE